MEEKCDKKMVSAREAGPFRTVLPQVSALGFADENFELKRK